METYATVTQKGQVTLPVGIRKVLGIKPRSKVKLSLVKEFIKVEALPDIFDIAPIGKAPKGINALKGREYMEMHYKRF